MERDHIALLREEKSWFGKFADVWRNPRLGYVFINKKSKNVNIYLGFKKLRGKVLLWSSRRKTRWVTKKWLKNGHSMLLWKDKTRVKVDLKISGPDGTILPREAFDTIRGGDWDTLTEYLEREDVKSELRVLTEGIKDSLDQYIINMPYEFMLPIIIPIIVLFVIIAYQSYINALMV